MAGRPDSGYHARPMPASLPPLPQRIGPYRILAPLGTGGMAAVYRAEQSALGRTVALKVIHPQFAADDRFRARFLREAQAGAKVAHPHVVGTFDAGTDADRLYLALELVTGGDLQAHLQRRGGQLTEAEALRLIRDCLDGLQAIEAAGLIHRDIKPANIFLDGHGRAKLADLGLARDTSSDLLTTPGMIVGTPAYMPPEQAQGASDLDIRTDLYAIGATLYHLLAGEAPFASATPVSTLVKVINDPLPDPRMKRGDLTDGCLALLAALMAKDRARRFPSASAALADLERTLAGSGPRLAATSVRAPAPAPPAPAAASPPPPRVPTPPPRPGIPHGAQRIDQAHMAILAKRVIVAQDGMSAHIILAPGASFPRNLLERMATAAGILHGVDPMALHEASRTATVVRRIILARGDLPSPGCAGRSVLGDPVTDGGRSVAIRVDDRAQHALALTAPGQPVRPADLDDALRACAIRHGLDTAALRRLVDGPFPADGRLVVATATAAAPGRVAGFVLPGGAQHAGGAVESGAVVATWDPGAPSRPGMDVLGRAITPLPLPPPSPPDALAGEGVEIARDRDGRLILRALRPGTVLRNPDGRVRVAGVREIAGDLGPEDAPIQTDDVVVVRGSVRAGAVIRTTSDVVVCGDLADAAITAGGCLQVTGQVGGSGGEVVVGGTLEAGALAAGTVLAGSVRIHGEVRNCAIVATGDVAIDRIIGGCVTAGGVVQVVEAGDALGTTTELWAGHSLAAADQHRIAAAAAARHEAERNRLVGAATRIAGEIDAIAQARSRIDAARVADPAAKAALAARQAALERERGAMAMDAERTRQTLAAARAAGEHLRRQGDDGAAAVVCSKIAHKGVVVRLADIEPEHLDAPRLRYSLQLGG
jgi:serine/threonine protein kinase